MPTTKNMCKSRGMVWVKQSPRAKAYCRHKKSAEKKCKKDGRVWVKRTSRAKAYCRDKPRRAQPGGADAFHEPGGVDADDYKYEFTSELKFEREDGERVPCELVHQDIKNFIDNHFNTELRDIQEGFNIYFNQTLVANGIQVPDLTLTSISRENCSIKFVFSSPVKITKRVYRRLIIDTLDNVNIFIQQDDELRGLFLEHNIVEFSFLTHPIPYYKNEANLSDTDYQYKFKVYTLFTQNGEGIGCNNEGISDLKRRIMQRTVELNDILCGRLNRHLAVNNKHNMVVTNVSFNFRMCVFIFTIQNNGPLTEADYRFISQYNWDILTDEEIADIELGEINFEIEQEGAEYDYLVFGL